jgi:hypothetical protein
MILRLYHATRAEFMTFDPSKSVDGGLHFGTEAQARMRAGSAGRMMVVELTVSSPRRSRDTGGHWGRKIASAKAAGCDSIVYLNRYEGVPLVRILEAQEQGIDLDKLTDQAFRDRVPEAMDSWIAFSADQVGIVID